MIIGYTADIRVVNGPDGFNGSPAESPFQIREPIKQPEKGGALLGELWGDKIYVRVCLV